MLALAGALGAALHGAYDLANLANPPEALATDLPSASDPRGFGTFALSGLALGITGCLILRGGGCRAASARWPSSRGRCSSTSTSAG